MLSSSVATSDTARPIGPGVSWKCTSGENPARLISPVVTRKPKRLVNEAGIRMDPPVAPAGVLSDPDKPEVRGHSRCRACAGAAGLTRQVVGVLGVAGQRRGGEP